MFAGSILTLIVLFGIKKYKDNKNSRALKDVE